MPEPEGAVLPEEMVSLIAPVAVLPVRIDHEIETLAGLVQGIYKLERILVMDIVIPRAVCDFQIDGTHPGGVSPI